MGWHLNIIAIKQHYSKVVEYLDVLSVVQQNTSFEVVDSSLNPQTSVSNHLYGFILIFDTHCEIFHDKVFMI